MSDKKALSWKNNHLITLWGNRFLTKLRKSFRKEFVKKLAREYYFEFKMFEEELWKNGLGNILYSEEYCTQCYDDDKMFRGKILVEINDDENMIWVEFCDVLHPRDSEVGYHPSTIVFGPWKKQKYLKFVDFITKCAETEAGYGRNMARSAKECGEEKERRRKMGRL